MPRLRKANNNTNSPTNPDAVNYKDNFDITAYAFIAIRLAFFLMVIGFFMIVWIWYRSQV